MGFTLVELLLALAIMSLLLTLLVSLTRGTLRFGATSSARAATLAALSDAEGYMSDTLRNAKGVYRSWTLLVQGETVTCTVGVLNGEPGRCLAVAAPVLANAADQRIVNFDLKLFLVRPIGALYASDGLTGGLNAVDALALLEYRVPNLCGAGGCAQVPPLGDTFTVSGPVGVVLTGLAADDQAGSRVRVLNVPDEESDTVELTLVVRARTPSGSVWVAQQTPIPLQVAIR